MPSAFLKNAPAARLTTITLASAFEMSATGLSVLPTLTDTHSNSIELGIRRGSLLAMAISRGLPSGQWA